MTRGEFRFYLEAKSPWGQSQQSWKIQKVFQVGSKNELKRRLLTRILKAAVFAFPHLSAKSSLRFGVVLGYLSYFFLPRERKRALQNLALALKNEKSADEMISI